MKREQMQERIEYLESLERIQSARMVELQARCERQAQENAQQLHYLVLTTKRFEQLEKQNQRLSAYAERLKTYTEQLRDYIESVSPQPLMVWSEDKDDKETR